MRSPSEEMDLRWSVGKFVYARGGSTLLHYMPLHDYHLEEGLNVAITVSMRSARLAGGKPTFGSMELSRWIDVTQVETLATISAALIVDTPIRAPATIVEYDAGIGVLFECLKLALTRRQADASFQYIGIGPDRLGRKFLMLHDSDWPKPTYLPEAGSDRGDLVILNHASGIREPDGPVVVPEEVIPHLTGPALMALRVTEAAVPEERTTVTGRQVRLPSLVEIAAACARGGDWHYRYLANHDAAYFLPQPGARTGLLLAYRSPTTRIPRFRPVVGPDTEIDHG